VFQPRTFLEVFDRKFDRRVITMELIDLDDVTFQISQKGKVSPVGPQRSLFFVDETRATHKKTQGVLLA